MIPLLEHLADRGAASIHAKGRVGTAALVAEMPARLDGLVLEIGCGTGETAAHLCTKGLTVVGTDVSSRMLACAVDRARWCGVRRSFIPVRTARTELPFADQTFSAVVAESVLAIQSPELVRDLVGEIRRVVMPGGRVLVNETVWLPHMSREEAARANEVALANLGIVQAVLDPFDAGQWADMFAENDLAVIQMEGLDQLRSKPIGNAGFLLRTRSFTAMKRLQTMWSLEAISRGKALKRLLEKVALPPRSLEGVLFVLERRRSAGGSSTEGAGRFRSSQSR